MNRLQFIQATLAMLFCLTTAAVANPPKGSQAQGFADTSLQDLHTDTIEVGHRSQILEVRFKVTEEGLGRGTVLNNIYAEAVQSDCRECRDAFHQFEQPETSKSVCREGTCNFDGLASFNDHFRPDSVEMTRIESIESIESLKPAGKDTGTPTIDLARVALNGE